MFSAKIGVKKGCPIADSLNLLHIAAVQTITF